MGEFIEWLMGRRDPLQAPYIDWRGVEEWAGIAVVSVPVLTIGTLVLAG